MPTAGQNPALYAVLARHQADAAPVRKIVAGTERLLKLSESHERFNHVTVINAPCETYTIDDAANDCGPMVVFVSGGIVTLHGGPVQQQQPLSLAAGSLVILHFVPWSWWSSPTSGLRITLNYSMLENEPIVVVMRNVSRVIHLDQAHVEYIAHQQPRLVRLFRDHA